MPVKNVLLMCDKLRTRQPKQEYYSYLSKEPK